MELRHSLWYPFTDEDYEDGVRKVRTWMGSENKGEDDPLTFILNWLFERLTAEAHDYSGVLRPFENFSKLLTQAYKVDQSKPLSSFVQFKAYRDLVLQLDLELAAVLADVKRSSLRAQLMKLQANLRQQFGVAAVIHDKFTIVTQELSTVFINSVTRFPVTADHRHIVIHYFLPLAKLRDDYTFTQSQAAFKEFLEMADYLLEVKQLRDMGVGYISPRGDTLGKYLETMERSLDKLEVAALVEGLL